MDVRKSTIQAIIGLSLIVISIILGPLVHLSLTILPVLIQVAGNLIFGMALVSYFIKLKENSVLKWSCLCVGVIYITNLILINSLLSYLIGNYDLFDFVSKKVYYYIYLTVADFIMIWFGCSFSAVSRINKAINYLSKVFIATSAFYLATSIMLILASNFKEVDVLDVSTLTQIGDYVNLTSYLLLIGIFIVLFNNQKDKTLKKFNVNASDIVE